MSDAEKVEGILSGRVTRIDDIFGKVAKLVELVPSLQHQKEADWDSLALIRALPPDFLEENASKWLALETENNRIFSSNLPTISDVNPGMIQATLTTASGTATPYFTSGSNLVASYQSSPDPRPEWVDRVMIVMDEHNSRISQRDYIPTRFDLLNRDLGKMFKVAMQSFNKCQNGILGVDNCAMHLRDIIQQVWGGLANKATVLNTSRGVNPNDLQLKKQADRESMADILSSPTFPKAKLLLILDDLYDLHYKFSNSRFGKNILNTDFQLLKAYYSRWLSDMDSISAIVI